MLVMLNLTVVRVVRGAGPCEKASSFFAPSRAIRAMVKLVTGQEFKRKPPRAFVDQRKIRHSKDLHSLRQGAFVAVVPERLRVAVSTDDISRQARVIRRLPSDVDPTWSPHLQAKK